MTQFTDAQKRQKPFTKRIIGLTILGFVAIGLTNCKNQDKTPSATTPVTTDKAVTTPPTTSTIPTGTTKAADQLKPAEAAQSPLHKLLDSLNVAGQPQWKLRYLDSVAQKNKNITIPQLRRVFDSLGNVKRGFIKK